MAKVTGNKARVSLITWVQATDDTTAHAKAITKPDGTKVYPVDNVNLLLVRCERGFIISGTVQRTDGIKPYYHAFSFKEVETAIDSYDGKLTLSVECIAEDGTTYKRVYKVECDIYGIFAKAYARELEELEKLGFTNLEEKKELYKLGFTKKQ